MLKKKEIAAKARIQKHKDDELKWKSLMNKMQQERNSVGAERNQLRLRLREMQDYCRLTKLMQKIPDGDKLMKMIDFTLEEKIKA